MRKMASGHAAINRLGVAHGLAGGDIDQIDAGLRKGPRDADGVIAGDTAFGPVGS